MKAAPAVYAPKSARSEFAQRTSTVGTQINTAQIGAVGSVANRGQLAPGNDIFPETITGVYANATGSPVDVMFFDPVGIAAAVLGGSYSDPGSWSGGLSNALVNKYLESRPVTFGGINYRVTTGTAAQYDQGIFYVKGMIDGSLFKKPVNVGQYQRNTQQNTLVQTVKVQFTIDQFSGLLVTVGANTTIAIDFYISEVFQSMVG